LKLVHRASLSRTSLICDSGIWDVEVAVVARFDQQKPFEIARDLRLRISDDEHQAAREALLPLASLQPSNQQSLGREAPQARRYCGRNVSVSLSVLLPPEDFVPSTDMWSFVVLAPTAMFTASAPPGIGWNRNVMSTPSSVALNVPG